MWPPNNKLLKVKTSVLHEAISSLRYRNAMDIDHLLNYSCENDAVIESPIDEEIIQGIMNTSADNDHDPYDSYSLPNVFQAVVTSNTYFIQQEKNTSHIVHSLQKIKDETEFDLKIKKKQTTLDAYFRKEVKYKLSRKKIINNMNFIFCLLLIFFYI